MSGNRKIPSPWQGPWPTFRIPPARDSFPRAQTDQQRADDERVQAEYYQALGVALGLYQWVCTRLGNHARCARSACRRLGRCVGRRPEDDWGAGFLAPLIPPCEPLDEQRVYQLRDEVNLEIWRACCVAGKTPPEKPKRVAGTPLVLPDE